MNFSNLFPSSTQVRISRWCAEMCCVKDALESEQKNRKSDAWKLMKFLFLCRILLPVPKNFYRLETDGGVEQVEPLVGRQFPSQACVSPCIDVCFLAHRLLNKFEWQQKHKRRSFKAEKKKIVVLHNFGIIFWIISFTSGKTCSIKK